MKSLFSFFLFFGGIKCNATTTHSCWVYIPKSCFTTNEKLYTGFSLLNRTKLHFFLAFVMAIMKQDTVLSEGRRKNTNGLCIYYTQYTQRSTYLLDSSKSLILVMKMLASASVGAAASVWSLLETNSFIFFRMFFFLSLRLLCTLSLSIL